MTVQTVTLNMPEALYQRAKQAADVLKRPVEDIIVDTLASTLPLLDDVPAGQDPEYPNGKKDTAHNKKMFRTDHDDLLEEK